MKRTVILAALLLLAALAPEMAVRALAQAIVPNGGFEQWNLDSLRPDATYPTGHAFHPVGWGGGNFGDSVGDTSRNFFQSTDAHSGHYAFGGRVIAGDTIGPSVQTTGFYSIDSIYFPMVGSPSALEGWYKLRSVGNDYLVIALYFLNPSHNRILGVLFDSSSHASYTHFSIPLIQEDSGGGQVVIQVGNMQGKLHPGTEFVMDDLAFSGFASVPISAATNFGLQQNYPNPFQGSTTIRYSLPANEHVTLEILNMLGERVALLEVGNESPGNHQIFFNGERFASGPYVCRLITASHGVSTNIIQLSH